MNGKNNTKLYPFINRVVNKRFNNSTTPPPPFYRDGGYANGYVAVPPEHPWFGKDYNEIDHLINVHGGLTFSASSNECRRWDDTENIIEGCTEIPADWWVFGFDTLHYSDNLDTWSRDTVIIETLNLKAQLEEVWA